MSDEEIAQRVAARAGRAFVGFKDPGRTAGVDDKGHWLIEREVVARGIAHLESLGVEIERVSNWIPAVVARIPTALVPAVRQLDTVEYVEPLVAVRLAGGIAPLSLPRRSGQDTTWNVQYVEAPQSWVFAKGANATVAIIDTGAQPDHPDLSYDVAPLACDGSDGLDQGTHGTQMAGIVAARDNGTGIIGVAPEANLLSVKIFDFAGLTPAEVECAIGLARDSGSFVVNLSFWVDSTSIALTDAINNAYSAGVLFVGAAGNSVPDVLYPANLGSVIAAVAVDSTGERAPGMPSGSQIELAAPGSNIVSTCNLSDYCNSSGSSAAAAHVTGAAAILKSYFPGLSNTQVRDRLRAGASQYSQWSDSLGFGAIRALESLKAVQVVVQGPSLVSESGIYTWSAAYTSAFSPSFQWYVTWAGGSIDTLGTGANQSLSLDWNSSNFQIKVVATVGSHTRDASKSVDMQIPPPAPTVAIVGPTAVPPFTNETWHAQIDGANPPFEYSWWRTDGGSWFWTTSESFYTGQGCHPFWLRVFVTNVGQDSLLVQMDSFQDPICPD